MKRGGMAAGAVESTQLMPAAAAKERRGKHRALTAEQKAARASQREADRKRRSSERADKQAEREVAMPRNDLLFGWDRATMEPERVALNALIRATKNIEGLADFDQVMGSPADPTYPNPLLYIPDLLHPNTLGFQVMADALPLQAMTPPPFGRCALQSR